MTAEACATDFTEAFEAETSARVRTGIAASAYSTFSIGGHFQYFVEIDTPRQLQAASRFLHANGLKPRILGFGSNSVLPDGMIRGWVFKLGRGFRFVDMIDSNSCVVGAGASLMTLSRKVSELGLSGLEFAGGIPASLGGALRMNAGAHGGQISDVVQEVTYMNSTGESVVVPATELSFSYRSCSLPRDAIVSAIKLQFVESSKDETVKRRAENLAYRKKTQPLTLPSTGSTFRNHVRSDGEIVPAGKLLEEAGMKGTQCGGAQISHMHANWIVNPERKATAKDVWTLIATCQEAVQKQFDIVLQPEVVDWR